MIGNDDKNMETESTVSWRSGKWSTSGRVGSRRWRSLCGGVVGWTDTGVGESMFQTLLHLFTHLLLHVSVHDGSGDAHHPRTVRHHKVLRV